MQSIANLSYGHICSTVISSIDITGEKNIKLCVHTAYSLKKKDNM